MHPGTNRYKDGVAHMIEGKSAKYYRPRRILNMHRNSKPLGGWAQDHDRLRRYWNLYWHNLPDRSPLCGWKHLRRYQLRGYAFAANFRECNEKQRRCYLPSRVSCS